MGGDVVTIERARRSEAVAVLAAAFPADEEAVHLLPDPERRARVIPRFLAAECADSQRHRTLFGLDVDGKLAGVAAWLPPGTFPIPVRHQIGAVLALVPVLPWVLGAAAEARRGQAAILARQPIEPHWFLRVVGVRPGHQGTGVGRRLIAPLLGRADDEGVGSFLNTTTEATVAYYRGFGFGVTETYRPTPTWPPVWGMWRDPR